MKAENLHPAQMLLATYRTVEAMRLALVKSDDPRLYVDVPTAPPKLDRVFPSRPGRSPPIHLRDAGAAYGITTEFERIATQTDNAGRALAVISAPTVVAGAEQVHDSINLLVSGPIQQDILTILLNYYRNELAKMGVEV